MLKLEPIFVSKIWGGNKIKNIFNPSEEINNIGEAWICSGIKGSTTLVEGTGLTLEEYYRSHKDEFNNYNSESFPLLVKILDANKDLSIQVHPNNEQAKRLENYEFGKSECWYILDKEENTKLIVGVKSKNKEEMKQMINEGKWSEIINKIDIEKGDVYNITPGTVHALKAGTLVYELQQSSDITYRLYDYDRLDDNGKKRELHIDKAIEVTEFGNKNFKQDSLEVYDDLVEIEKNSIVRNEYFNLEKWDIETHDQTISISLEVSEHNFLICTIIEGELEINNKVFENYSTFIITSKELDNIDLNGKCKLLVGYPL